MDFNSSQFRQSYFKDWDHISEHGIDSCHNYFGMNETQYIMNYAQASDFMKLIEKKYYILQLKGEQVFSYDNVYMDSKELALFHQDKKNQHTIRTRQATRTNTIYFQIKHRSHERVNVYSREYTGDTANKLTPAMWNFYQGISELLTGDSPEKFIFPVVQVSYDRYILYHKKHGERVDIDQNIRFTNLRDPKKATYKLDNIVMVESKSSKKNSYAEKHMESIGAKKSKASLYQLAMHYINYPSDTKAVKKAVKKIIKLQNI